VRLHGIHHVTCITGDAPRNLEYYTGTLGLRLVKKTVNQDDPTIYHLFYADELGSAGADITFFEYPGAIPGRAGDGMVHRIAFRVGSEESLDFWHDRVGGDRHTAKLRFDDPEGLGLELVLDDGDDEPLTAHHPEIPAEHALRGFAGVRAYSSSRERSDDLLERLTFTREGDAWESRGLRHSFYAYDAPEGRHGIPGAGTVHHVAWAVPLDEHPAWVQKAAEAGVQPTPVIDRFWFRSIYFREPSGVLFEIASLGPGFTVDEEQEHLGEKLILPPRFEHLRAQIEPNLTPLPVPTGRGA
jgi:glyoxalase family protein